MRCTTTPGGCANGLGRRPSARLVMKSTQIGSAALAPASPRPSSRMSSKPTHTRGQQIGREADEPGVLVRSIVPVLPAAGALQLAGRRARSPLDHAPHAARRSRRRPRAASPGPARARASRARVADRWMTDAAAPSLPAGGEGGVGVGQLERRHRRACRAPATARARPGSGESMPHACATSRAGRARRRLDSSLIATVLIDCASATRRRTGPAELFLLVVLRLPAASIDLGRVVQDRRRRELLGLDRRRVDERLERRARLPLGAQRAIEAARPG